MQELIKKVEQWADDRNFFCKENGATVQAQFVKLTEEIGELSGNIARGRDCRDDIGDIAVVLIIMNRLDGNLPLREITYPPPSTIYDAFNLLLMFVGGIANDLYRGCGLSTSELSYCLNSLNAIATLQNTTIKECLTVAYNDIKDRKGKFINHVFVKESDL